MTLFKKYNFKNGSERYIVSLHYLYRRSFFLSLSRKPKYIVTNKTNKLLIINLLKNETDKIRTKSRDPYAKLIYTDAEPTKFTVFFTITEDISGKLRV